MALVVQTGRQLTLEIDGVDYSIQTAEVTLTPSQTVDQYVTLTGNAAKSQPVTWTLNVRAFQDWGEGDQFAESMITAATAGNPIPFELALPGGATATGNIIPVFPSAGGAADAALEMDLTFAVDGAVTFA
jgi:hypothetical protein